MNKDFLGIMVVVYLLVYVTSPSLFHVAIFETYSILLSILPVLILVFGFMFCFNLFIKAESIRVHLGQDAKKRGWFFSIIAGIFSTGPIYIWYPLLADLRGKGMRTSFVSTFLYSRSVKLPLLPIMVHYFGFNYTLILSTYIILASVVAGYVTERVVDGSSASYGK